MNRGLLLIAAGILLSGCCWSDARLLLRGISNGDDTAVELALKQGADPNCKSFDGGSPIHASVISRQPEILETLLKYNADPNLTEAGKSPLFLAALIDCIPCAEVLNKYSAISIADEADMTRLYRRPHIKNEYWTKLLEKSGAK